MIRWLIRDIRYDSSCSFPDSLINAIDRSDRTLVEKLLSDGISPNYSDAQGEGQEPFDCDIVDIDMSIPYSSGYVAIAITWNCFIVVVVFLVVILTL